MAVGALRRVFKKRQGRERSQVRRRRAHVDDDESSGEESGEEGQYQAIRQKTTNHYTLNLAGPSGPPSDFSFRALGYVPCILSRVCAMFINFVPVYCKSFSTALSAL